MVVLQRNEVSRNRTVFFLTIILSAIVLAGAAVNVQAAAGLTRALWLLAGVVALVALALSVLQLYGSPKRSQALLFQNDDEIVIATNALHEGYKLRFLRDILGEHLTAFSDEERERWKALEADGFYAALHARNIRKLVILRLCMMIFDDVFVADRHNRWEHHESANTAEPTMSKREMPRLTSWKSSS